MLQKHYQLDCVFDAKRKKAFEDRVSGYSSLSEEAGDAFLDKEIEKGRLQNVC